MNCKFHPEAEAVTTCTKCGAEMCNVCSKNAYHYNDAKEPICLECSLKEAEIELTVYENSLKDDKKKGLIASIIWVIGLCLLPLGGFGIFIMLAAALFSLRGAIFAFDKEKGFFENIKVSFWAIIASTLACPFLEISVVNRDKKEVKKTVEKIDSIKRLLNS